MDGQRQRRARRPAGFTLVELIGVVALVVVLSIAAIPAIGAITRARQSATVAESARLITAARQRAMATSRPAGVEIDLVLSATVPVMHSGPLRAVAVRGNRETRLRHLAA